MTKLKFIGVLALILAFAGVAIAQETTSGSITGTVRDSQGAAVPGATVTLTSEQGAKTIVSDSQGRFFAPFLTPGIYTVKVELTGFSPVERKNVVVRLGQRYELDFTLKVGDLQEVIEVVGAAPVVDTSSTTAGGILDTDTMKKLPVGRNFTDTLYLVPGVSDSGGVGRSNPSVSGASGLENQYIVDGVNITNTGYGGVGSYSIVFFSLGTGVTTDFIKETQVKTAGFEAEYGQATGGVVNVVTQSGTNTFHGNLFGYFRPGFIESEYKQLDNAPNPAVNTVERNEYDFGISLGGPLVKDKVFFFGAFNPQYQNRTFTPPAGSPLQGEFERKRRAYSYAGKLTWQANSNHRFDVSLFGDPAKGELGPQRIPAALIRTDTAGFSEITYGGHNQMVKYDGILSPSWLVEASFSRATNKITEIPSVDEWAISDRTRTPFVTSGGIGFYEQGNDGKRVQYQVKSTNLFQAGGSHQVRYGFQYEDINYDNINQRTGPTFRLPDGSQTATGASVQILPDPTFGRIYRVTRANLNSGRATTQKYLSWFAQDTWQMGKLTLRPGVRYEQQELQGDEAVKLCREGETVPGRGDGNGALKPCSFKWDGNYAGRLGAIYDITGNGKSKIYASWGRFYAQIPNDLAARAMSADAGVTRADYFDAGLTRPVPDGVLAAGVTRHYLPPAGLHAAQIAADSKSTYQEEFLGGVEFEVARSVSLGVRYIHRSMPRILEDYQPAPVVAFDLGCPGADSVEYFIDNISPNLPRFTCAGVPDASFEEPEHNYDSVEVTLNKSFSDNWSMVTSYRWSRLKGLFEGFFRNDNGQSDPSITSLFDFPTNDPSYTQIGVPQFGYRGDIRFQGCSLGCGTLPNDRPHQLKVYANRTWGSFNAGMGLNVGSGKPLTELAANPNYQNSGEIPVTIRGGGIDTVDGFKERTATTATFDVHFDYTAKIGNQRVVLIADIFNLFNQREPTNFDDASDGGFGSPNPNYGQPVNGGGSRTPSYQAPRAVRLGARFEW